MAGGTAISRFYSGLVNLAHVDRKNPVYYNFYYNYYKSTIQKVERTVMMQASSSIWFGSNFSFVLGSNCLRTPSDFCVVIFCSALYLSTHAPA